MMKHLPTRNRAPTNPRIDKAFFAETAQKTKAINLPVRLYRGGIRM